MEQFKDLVVSLTEQFTNGKDKIKVLEMLIHYVKYLNSFKSENKKKLYVDVTILYAILIYVDSTNDEIMCEFFEKFNLQINDPNVIVHEMLFDSINSADNEEVENYLVEVKKLNDMF